MAVIYFTNNADSGDGSLRAAIASAQNGDVIRPDETVFERGSTIEIALASQLNVDKNLTIDGRQFSITLNGSGKTTCVYVEKYVAARFIRVDFVNGVGRQELEGMSPGGLYVRDNSTVTAEQCRFVGCKGSSSGGFAVRPYAVLNIYDCLVAACCGYSSTVGAGASVARDGTLNAIGSTFIGNVGIRGDLSFNFASGNLVNAIVGKLYVSSQCSVEQTACVVDVKPSRLGFATPPPDTIAAADWTPELWKSWDLHLLDDGSDTPSPYRDAGDVEHMSRYDLDGNFRGRETNGVATCSPGAYETIQADLFWIGKDADGNYTNSPRINNPAGWATSRFAYNGSNICPKDVESVFVQYNTYSSSHFQINADLGVHPKFVIGGGGFVKFGSACIIASREIVLGANAVLDAGGYVTPSLILGDKSSVYGRNEYFLTGETVYNAYDEAYVEYCEVTGRASGNIKSRQLRVKRKRNATVQLAGEYDCVFFQVLSPADSNADGYGDEFMIATEPGTTIHAVDVEINRHYSGEKVFTNPVDFKLFGERSYITGEYVEEGLTDNWNDDISFDVSGADLVLFDCDFYGGPILYGNNTNPNQYYNGVEFNRGNLKIDKRGLVTPKLSINDYRAIDNGASLKIVDAELSVADASICNVQILINSDGVDVLRASKSDIYGRFQLSGGTMEFGTLVVDVDGELFITEASVEADYLAVIYPKVAEINNSTLDVTDFDAGNATCTVNTSTVATQTVYIEGFFSVEFIGEDSVFRALTITSSDDVRCNGIGYLVVPENSRNFSMEQISPGVRVCDYGAGVEAITSSSTQPYVADVAWSGADTTVPVVVERKVADGWEVIDAQAVGSVALLDLGDETTIRVWDGEKFIEHTPSGFPFADYATCDYMFSQATCGTVDAETSDSFEAGRFYVGEKLTVKAALVDSPSEQPVIKDFVDSLSLTVYKVEGAKRIPVAGWFEVNVPVSVVSETLNADGFNVDYVSASSPFAEPGDYSAFFVARFKKGNPATLVMNVAVN